MSKFNFRTGFQAYCSSAYSISFQVPAGPKVALKALPMPLAKKPIQKTAPVAAAASVADAKPSKPVLKKAAAPQAEKTDKKPVPVVQKAVVPPSHA